MSLASLITDRRGSLTPAERRVLEYVLAEPEAVAFGTVAALAKASRTSGATVVRLATKLGFDGFAGLQAHIQADVVDRLRPAVERIRAPSEGDALAQVLATETRNLHATLASIDLGDYERVVCRLADAPGRILVLAGECVHGVGELLADQLQMLRPDVGMLEGNAQRIGRTLADLGDSDTVVAIDFRRYDQWLLTTARHVRRSGGFLVGCSDSPLSPLAELADIAFTVSVEGVSPFDSYVAAVALAGALVAGVARRLTPTAKARLDRIETNWRALGALMESRDHPS